ncbi:MAG: hypothetical protein V4725_11835 [Bacteroidota bacterium]
MFNQLMKRLMLSFVVLISAQVFAQDEPQQQPIKQRYVFFPHPMQKNWHVSLGYTLTALPEDITEEVQVRAPAGDLHALRKLSDSWQLDGRIKFQILQNHFSLGPRWVKVINEKLSMSIGDDFAWWFGDLNIGSFKTQGQGWLNYPNVAFGYRLKKELLLTVKAEALIKLSEKTRVGENSVSKSSVAFNGYGANILLEQPFHKRRSIILGFKAQYSNFFWQTWSLFETFDRYIFYPELTIGFIL